jgi:hypothetical protein
MGGGQGGTETQEERITLLKKGVQPQVDSCEWAMHESGTITDDGGRK